MRPTARTLARLRELGYVADVVERSIRGHGITFSRDYLGCIDIIAVRAVAGRPETLAVQACAGASHANRAAKAVIEPRLKHWLQAGNAFEVWSWAKQGARGKRKLWNVRREAITLDDLEGYNKRAGNDALTSPGPEHKQPSKEVAHV